MKRSLLVLSASAILIAGSLSPVLAQDNSGNGNSGNGIFGMFAQFFSRVFNHQQPNPSQPNNGNPMMEGNEATNGGQLNPQQGDENRLSGLVKAGKITDAQKTAILDEVSKIRSEIDAWAKSNNLDAGYIYGGLRGPMMNAGINQGQNPGRNDDRNDQNENDQNESGQRMGPPNGMMPPRGGNQPQGKGY